MGLVLSRKKNEQVVIDANALRSTGNEEVLRSA